jgi:1-acyl-sn-glycerol-3-phosphate acyltransferase
MTVLRSTAFTLWLWGVTLALCLWHGAFTHAPAAVAAAARSWARLILGGLRRLCRIDWEVSGGEHLPKGGPALLAPMHQSAFDTMIWITLLPDCVYVLKRELTLIPLFGTMLLRHGMIPVDRRGGAQALRRLLRGAEQAVARGRQIVIFPEGTRVAPGHTAPLLPGVAALPPAPACR